MKTVEVKRIVPRFHYDYIAPDNYLIRDRKYDNKVVSKVYNRRVAQVCVSALNETKQRIEYDYL